ncbi:zinc finger domain-containing protein [Mycobacterium malmoense]|uniref:zinc finger domain-containing protein n=1 Tax=Mycobacterium malmoense TaxID=1780 RepID=UPI003F8CEDF4
MPPDYAVGGSSRYGRGPVLEAYAETGALEVPCVNCGADAGVWCCHDAGVGGMPRRLPCPKRIQAAVRAQTNAQPPEAASRIGDRGEALK